MRDESLLAACFRTIAIGVVGAVASLVIGVRSCLWWGVGLALWPLEKVLDWLGND